MSRAWPLGVVLVLVGGPAFAQTPPLDAYRRGEIEMRLADGGMTPVVLRRDGALLDLGLLGGGAETIFDGSPAALDEMESFRQKRTLGVALWVMGLTALVTDILLLASGSDFVWEGEGENLEPGPGHWGLLIGGGVTGIAGGFLIQNANRNLGAAVDAYNEDLYRRLRGDPPSGPTARGVRWSGHF